MGLLHRHRPLKALLERIGLPLVPLAVADRARVAHPETGEPITSLPRSVYAVHRDDSRPVRRTTLPGLSVHG